jgi:hypothetical protein
VLRRALTTVSVNVLRWRASTIDYRLDNEKKNSLVGATSWYHCVAEDSRIRKMPAINPLQAIVPKTPIFQTKNAYFPIYSLWRRRGWTTARVDVLWLNASTFCYDVVRRRAAVPASIDGKFRVTRFFFYFGQLSSFSHRLLSPGNEVFG